MNITAIRLKDRTDIFGHDDIDSYWYFDRHWRFSVFRLRYKLPRRLSTSVAYGHDVSNFHYKVTVNSRRLPFSPAAKLRFSVMLQILPFSPLFIFSSEFFYGWYGRWVFLAEKARAKTHWPPYSADFQYIDFAFTCQRQSAIMIEDIFTIRYRWVIHYFFIVFWLRRHVSWQISRLTQ